ncbi:sensor histidine kinase [Rothia nasimurium]|uniref:sensor histidine kinase n=1 Tax=Rothia nasimurium TaxID=85336 RepID=UPI001F00B25B|nr:histidine kinase [Rothia nasimurium]
MDEIQVELDTVQRRKRLVNGLSVVLAQFASLLLAGVALSQTTYWWVPLLVWVVTTSSLYWRYSRPKTMTAVVVLGVFISAFEPFPALHLWWVVPVVVYHWARYGSRRTRIAMVVCSLVASVAGGVVFAHDMSVYLWSTPELLVGFGLATFVCSALTMMAWFLGDTRRLRENRHRALIERNRQLEHEREQERQLAALDERARIAREMHDIVAHSLSVIITQADGARYAGLARIQQEQTSCPSRLGSTAQEGPAGSQVRASLPSDDGEPLEFKALGTISSTARESLQQMRSLLGVLRTDEGQVFEPLPALHNIPQLIEQMQKLGYAVDYTQVEGVEEKLPQGAELTIYRIVQEALTNVRRHSPTTSLVTVALTAGKQSLDISVTNRPEASASAPIPGARRGLLGMRERVDMYGGTLQYGRLADGSFRVLAQIPFAP